MGLVNTGGEVVGTGNEYRVFENGVFVTLLRLGVYHLRCPAIGTAMSVGISQTW